MVALLTEHQDGLNCWPSDDNGNSTFIRKKHNLVEFYHQILWASQLNQQQDVSILKNNKKGSKRVTFSPDPPTVYEYEPEYNKSKLGFFDYQIFRRRFQQYSQQQKDEQYQFLSSKKMLTQQQDEVEDDDEEYKNHRLIKTRSISEFRPIRNSQFNSNTTTSMTNNNNTSNDLPYSFSKNLLDTVYVPLAQIDMFHTETNGNRVTPQFYQPSSDDDSDDPPPTYIEYNISSNSNNNRDENTNQESFQFCATAHQSTNDSGGHVNLSGKKEEEDEPKKEEATNSKSQAFFQRTLRKIKSSPKLIELQKRSSIASLRKKKSFSISNSA